MTKRWGCRAHARTGIYLGGVRIGVNQSAQTSLKSVAYFYCSGSKWKVEYSHLPMMKRFLTCTSISYFCSGAKRI